MADFAPPRTSSGLVQPLAKPPKTRSLQRNSSTLQRNPSSVQRNPSRRVYFDELATKQKAVIDDCEDPRGRQSSHCYTCCAWVSLAIGCVTLTVFILGGIFLGFLQGSMPDFQIATFNISKLDVATSGSQTFLTAESQLKFNVTNRNDLGVGYGPMKAEISSEHVKLGSMDIAAFTQSGHTSMELKIRTSVKKEVVDKDDMAELKSNYKDKKVVIDVVVKGSISILLKGHELRGFPLTIACREMEQTDIDSGFLPACNVKVNTFSWK